MTKHKNTKRTTGAPKRLEAIYIALLATLCPALAFAAAPFAGGTTGLSADILTIVAPIAGLALIAVGVICWFGKISWFWFAGLVVGIVLVFGNQQVVSWIRGLFGV